MRGKFVEVPEAVAVELSNKNIISTADNKFFVGDTVIHRKEHSKSIKINETKSVDCFIEIDCQMDKLAVFLFMWNMKIIYM